MLELASGRDFFGDGFQGDEAHRRAAWEDLREPFLKVWTRAPGWREIATDSMWANLSASPGTRPWAWWEYEAPEPLPRGEPEAEYLRRKGLLADHEIAQLDTEAPTTRER